ncbi:MAG: hypothetical protein ACRDIB_20490 [Ardenticatenaceae bacterium]
MTRQKNRRESQPRRGVLLVAGGGTEWNPRRAGEMGGTEWNPRLARSGTPGGAPPPAG